MNKPFNAARRLLLAAATVTALGAITPVAPVLAWDEDIAPAVNLDEHGVALHGHDPVSYFSGAPVKGKREFTASHEGARYWFASAANRDAFQAEPARFAPAYGGYCAMGVALGKKLDVDPRLWRVVDGRPYLNVHKDAQVRWTSDVKGHVAQADKNWPGIRDKAPKDL